MRVAIMQPYLFPYIGYYQLIGSVDLFIVYDNIKYTKKGWINRNRFLSNASDGMFSVPLRKDSDALDIRDRFVSPDFNRAKLLNQLKESYRKAPFFERVYPLVQEAITNDEPNLFAYLKSSIVKTCNYLEINTPIIVSSTIDIDHNLSGQNKVLALCESVKASLYVNPIGGQELYSKQDFMEHGVELAFLRSKPIEYEQFANPFIPWLSIIDVMMFNSKDRLSEYLEQGYELA